MNKILFKSGVYEIVNVINGHRYIGGSVDLQSRRGSHFSSLRRNDHRNAILQKAFNKYGESSLLFRVLIYCDPDNVLLYEQKCLDELLPEYNIAKDAQAFMRGAIFSEEHRRKLGLVHKGKIVSEETRRKMSLARVGKTPPNTLGYRHTEETKQKMSLAHMGNKYNLGRHMPEETKHKISEAHKMNKTNCGETNPFFGKHHSEETKRKMSKSIKEALARKREL